eukprot:gene9179-9960_t
MNQETQTDFEMKSEELREDEVETAVDQNVPPNDPQGDVPPNDPPGNEAGGLLSKAASLTGGTAVGAAIGYGAVVVGFTLIGLSPVGPVAGGWFAANMGAGLAAGSWMATLQSAAMTSTAYYAGGTVGGVLGGAATASKL